MEPSFIYSLVLIAEIKQKYVDQLKELGVIEDGNVNAEKPKAMEVEDQSNKPSEASYHMKLEFFDKDVFNDVYDLVSFAAERNTSKSDREKVHK